MKSKEFLKKRYFHDPKFKSVVSNLLVMVENGSLDHEELKDAVDTAILIDKERKFFGPGDTYADRIAVENKGEHPAYRKDIQ